MTGISIRIEGDRELVAKLSAAAARLEHPRGMWEEIGFRQVLATQLRFEAERDPDGNRWPASIRVLTEGGKTLTDSGALRNSIKHEASDTGVAVGTNAIQAAVHQFGATIRAKSDAGLSFRIGENWITKDSVEIPRRAFLGLSVDDEQEVIEIAGDFVLASLGEAHAR